MILPISQRKHTSEGPDVLSRGGRPWLKYPAEGAECLLSHNFECNGFLQPHLSMAVGERASVAQAIPDMLEVLAHGQSKGNSVQLLLKYRGARAQKVQAHKHLEQLRIPPHQLTSQCAPLHVRESGNQHNSLVLVVLRSKISHLAPPSLVLVMFRSWLLEMERMI